MTQRESLQPQQEAAAANAGRLFNEALFFLNRNEPNMAACVLKRALKLQPHEPRYLSYLGVCLATADKRATEAIMLCEEAAHMVGYDALLYGNLGRVHLLLGNRRKAHAAFRQGLALERDNRYILRELQAMGSRQKKIFSFLPRRHLLNRLAGRLRHVLRRSRV